MKVKVVLIVVSLMIFFASTALAQAKQIPETEINLGFYFLDSTIDSLQKRVGKLTFVETKRDLNFPISFDIYRGQGLDVDVMDRARWMLGWRSICSKMKKNLEDGL